MAIKDWVSKFSAGTAIDDTAAGGMETLVNTTDDTRVAQPHALRDSLIEVEKQIRGAPWFEWNATDLTQFDTKVDGSAVTSSTVSVVSFAGLNWVEIDVTSGAGNALTSSTLLPITATPPTANYLVEADFICTQLGTSSRRGAGLAVRYTSGGPDLYHKVYAGTVWVVYKTSTGTPAQLGSNFDVGAELNAVNQGTRLSLACYGSGTEAVVRPSFSGEGSEYHIADTSSPHTAVGQACLIGSAVDAATQTINKFRNIRCYTLLNV